MLIVPIKSFTEVAVAGGGFVDRAEEVEILDDTVWGEVVAGDLFYLAINNDGLLEGLGFATSQARRVKTSLAWCF